MNAFNATIKTDLGIYYIDLKTHSSGEHLFNVIFNGQGCYFGSIAEALAWVKEHSDYFLANA
jgi:hypothetical protein